MHFVDEAGGQVLANGRHASAEPLLLAGGCVAGAGQSRLNPLSHKMERRASLHDERGTRIVCQHEHRRVVGRIRAPPAFPGLIRPRPAHGAKHIAPQNPSADSLEPSCCKFVVNASRSFAAAMHALKGPRRKKPLMQRHPADPKGILLLLIRPRPETVDRHTEAADTQATHWVVSLRYDSTRAGVLGGRKGDAA